MRNTIHLSYRDDQSLKRISPTKEEKEQTEEKIMFLERQQYEAAKEKKGKSRHSRNETDSVTVWVKKQNGIQILAVQTSPIYQSVATKPDELNTYQHIDENDAMKKSSILHPMIHNMNLKVSDPQSGMERRFPIRIQIVMKCHIATMKMKEMTARKKKIDAHARGMPTQRKEDMKSMFPFRESKVEYCA